MMDVLRTAYTFYFNTTTNQADFGCESARPGLKPLSVMESQHHRPTSCKHHDVPTVSTKKDIHIGAEWQASTMVVRPSPIYYL